MIHKRNIAVIFGTRPDTIKLAPVILQLRKEQRYFNVVPIATAQHRHMLDQVLRIFNIKPKHDLNVMQPRQSLATLTKNLIGALETVVKKEKPDMILVQGDTTTTFVGSLVAFYHQIPVGHVEAGLRTFDRKNPFPEEINRRLTSCVTDLHFAPTQTAKQALVREHFDPSTIFVTGNSVIDALQIAVRPLHRFQERILRKSVASNRRIVLMTMHRRENWGTPMIGACQAMRTLAFKYPDHFFIFPVHLNPIVRETVYPILHGIPNIALIEPLDYQDFTNLMAHSYLIITDSGGVQEEGPALGKPVLVLRTVTERPEAVNYGTVKLVGLDEKSIVNTARLLLDDRKEYQKMAEAVNPYGDGHAAERTVGIMKKYFGFTNRTPKEFVPQ
jgi:UDP-N-acetylglucosamine 2-epimerase (non-hydrolysing)